MAYKRESGPKGFSSIETGVILQLSWGVLWEKDYILYTGSFSKTRRFAIISVKGGKILE